MPPYFESFFGPCTFFPFTVEGERCLHLRRGLCLSVCCDCDYGIFRLMMWRLLLFWALSVCFSGSTQAFLWLSSLWRRQLLLPAESSDSQLTIARVKAWYTCSLVAVASSADFARNQGQRVIEALPAQFWDLGFYHLRRLIAMLNQPTASLH